MAKEPKPIKNWSSMTKAELIKTLMQLKTQEAKLRKSVDKLTAQLFYGSERATKLEDVSNDGDLMVRMDEPGSVYVKTAPGTWTPLPKSTDEVTSCPCGVGPEPCPDDEGKPLCARDSRDPDHPTPFPWDNGPRAGVLPNPFEDPFEGQKS